MKYLTGLACLLLSVTITLAQEKVPDEEAKNIAKMLAEHAAKAKLPLKIEADADKPFAMKDGEHGALVMPAKDLTADTIAKAGKDIVPIAQFWMKDLSPHVGGKVAPNDKLNLQKVMHDGNEVNLTLYVIGVRKGEKGLEACICTNDKEPLLVVPLEKADVKQDAPIQFEPKKGDNSADITVHCLGKYSFKITVGKQAE